MNLGYSLIVAGPPLLLLTAGLLTDRWANRHVRAMRRAVLTLVSAVLAMSVAAALMLAVRGPLDAAFWQWSRPLPLSIGVYFDSLAAVMMLLISFIGLVIARYSVRYLDGDAAQGRFLKWIAFTLGAVLLLVVSRNLVMCAAAWMLTSFGLHQLLTHYRERPWAIWAARKKFLISRLGDVVLISAIGLTFYGFGSFEYGEIFPAARALQQSSPGGSWLLSSIGVLFAVGAMTKSAQLPFHSWLPDTMETPTPVSALMHAGIINAGGFLMVRLSTLLSLSPLALDLLAAVGALTALYGGVVMLTQTSIKRSLAYSTIAQMGFMMLQCGLGAFSAALLHIVAHSLYKAHAFLSSGSVLDAAERIKSDAHAVPHGGRALVLLPAAIAIAVGLGGSAAWILGIDAGSKPGMAVLGLILVLALTQLIWQALAAGTLRLAIWGVGAAAVVCWSYLVAYLLVDGMLASSLPSKAASFSLLDAVVLGMVAAGFIGVFVLQAVAGSLSHWPPLQALYVHAANGFYFDVPARRLTAWFWGRTSPVP